MADDHKNILRRIDNKLGRLLHILEVQSGIKHKQTLPADVFDHTGQVLDCFADLSHCEDERRMQYGATLAIAERRIITRQMIMRRISGLAAFKRATKPTGELLDVALHELRESGDIQQVQPVLMQQAFNFKGDSYILTEYEPHIFDPITETTEHGGADDSLQPDNVGMLYGNDGVIYHVAEPSAGALEQLKANTNILADKSTALIVPIDCLNHGESLGLPLDQSERVAALKAAIDEFTDAREFVTVEHSAAGMLEVMRAA